MIKVKINGETFNSSYKVFSGGEVQTKIDFQDVAWSDALLINATLKCSDDVVSLLQVNDIVRRRFPRSSVALRMKYAPYARQDRVCAEGESLACKVFATMINSCKFTTVYISDCHSDVLPALINNCLNQSVEEIIKCHIKDLDTILSKTKCVLVSPDAGSNKKVFNLAKAYGGLEVIRADKCRDTSTGEITDTEVFCDNLQGKHCIIVDDICDGGYTFLKLAEKLKEKGAGIITLFVTHGIFSKGEKVFDGLIDNIYTTDSFAEIDQFEKIKVVKI